jgi:hypothetical protein
MINKYQFNKRIRIKLNQILKLSQMIILIIILIKILLIILIKIGNKNKKNI